VLVPGAGQQLAGVPGDCPADLAHEGPEALDLGAEPVIVPAQPVGIGLKLSYLLGQRLKRCHDVLARLPTITGISPPSITESPQLMGPRRVVIDVR
jgi:hypothetical protein